MHTADKLFALFREADAAYRAAYNAAKYYPTAAERAAESDAWDVVMATWAAYREASEAERAGVL